MSSFLLVCLLVAAGGAVWPLNRFALRHGATPVGIGIVLSAVTLAGGLVGALVTGQPIYHPAAFFYGALGGLTYAVGFVLIILRCLAIGPIGPTAVASTLGFAGTVLATAIVPYAPPATVALYAGMGATLLAVVLMAIAPVTTRGGPGSDWSRLVMAGWAFSAIASAAQFLSGRFAPQAPFGYIVAQALVSLLLLLIVASTGGSGRPKAPDLLAGAGTGLIAAALVPLSATVMTGMLTVTVYPVVVAAPALLIVLLGALAYRERLTVWGWISCASGIAALALLSLPRS